MNEITLVDQELVKQIQWTGDSKQYDLELQSLGPKHEPFIIMNPWVSDSRPFYFIEDFPDTRQCVVWTYEGEWIAKMFPVGWTPDKQYLSIEIVLPRMKWVRNPNLSKHYNFRGTEYKQEFLLDAWQSKNELVWYLDPEVSPIREKVWAFKLMPVGREPVGIIDMGLVMPRLPRVLDVIFISYQEPNCEENWQRVLEKAPYAKRVHGVTGIFEAHKAAAYLADTDMFYVVDGDAWLVDDWRFNFKAELFDRNITYVWRSRNPFNDLDYGYGGVKLFNKQKLLRTKQWTTIDLTTTITKHLKVIDRYSVETRFNTDSFATWRSAFREGCKLCLLNDQMRLDQWVTKPKVKYSADARRGIKDAVNFCNTHYGDNKELRKINDYKWLREFYKAGAK